jgi:hypothetical protein
VNSPFSGNLFQCGFIISPIWDSLRPELEQYDIREQQGYYEIGRVGTVTGIEHE